MRYYAKIGSVAAVWAIVVLSLPSVANAGKVYLKDGKEISGEIISMDKKEVKVKTEYGIIVIDRDKVEKVVTGEKPPIEEKKIEPKVEKNEILLQEACAHGKADARRNVSEFDWMQLGCLFPLGWFNYAPFLNIYPPIEKLVGKDPEYVANYMRCYKAEMAWNAHTYVPMGCGVGNLINYLLQLWLVSLIRK